MQKMPQIVKNSLIQINKLSGEKKQLYTKGLAFLTLLYYLMEYRTSQCDSF